MERYSSHTDPLFKKIRCLKFKDLFELNILKFYYKLMNNNLRDYFLHLNKVTGAQTYSYNTRFRNNVRQIHSGTTFAGNAFILKLPELQTILHQIFLKKCTHTAITDLFYIC